MFKLKEPFFKIISEKWKLVNWYFWQTKLIKGLKTDISGKKDITYLYKNEFRETKYFLKLSMSQ